MKLSKNGTLIAVIVLLTINAILQALKMWAQVDMPHELMFTVRWAFAASMVVFAYQRRSLSAFIFAAMVVGILTGLYVPKIAVDLKILSDIFLKLIKTIIAPLLFGTLVVGIAGHSDIKQVGRMGWKSLVYFEIVTTFALILGLIAINLSGAGNGIEIPGSLNTADIPTTKAQGWKEIILHIFPQNIAKSVADGEVLQIVVFSVIFGIGMAMLSQQKRKPMLDFAESLSEIMFKFTNIVMYFAPLAVFGALAFTIGKYGVGVFSNLVGLLLTVYGALIAFVVLILIPVMLILRIPIGKFFKAVSEPATLAFATASSESALPIAMERMVEFGIPKKIVAFVMPTGYSFNLDGTTLYLSTAAIFVAQAQKVQLDLSTQIVMLLTLMLTSKGVAGVPRASIVILAATVSSFGLEDWPIAMILGIDAMMDMARTSVNVVGNCLASAVVARWEGELNVSKKPLPNHLDEIENSI